MTTPLNKTDEESKHKRLIRKNQEAKLNAGPCIVEHDLSLQCLEDNNYNRSKCANAFLNFTACKTFWNKIKVERQRKGIKPDIPPPEEREAIKREFIERNS